MRISFLAFFFCMISLPGCYSSKKSTRVTYKGISQLRFLDEFTLAHDVQHGGTTVGGLSGIDYDSNRDVYYLVCDDPSARSAARFYTAKILVNGMMIDTVVFNGVTTIRGPDGNIYPDITKDLLHSADLEAMRYDRSRDVFIRSSEGQRRTGNAIAGLQNPDIVIMDREGNWIDSIPLPANMAMQPGEQGPRHNSVFEGLDFGDNYNLLYVSVEEPLYEDGPRAGTGDSTAWVRWMKFDIRSKTQLAQYAYEIDPVPYPANSPGAFKINGISEIMHLGNEKFLVIERAYSTGRTETDIRVYLADLQGASDVSDIRSLKVEPAKNPVRKRLLLDMNRELEQEVYNVEGVSLGPVLPNGHRSLVFVTDNNFNSKEKTQFFLFEIIP